MDNALKKYLEENNIKYKTHKHSAVFTVSESKNNKDIQKINGLRTKSLFIKDEKENFYLVCLPGEKRLNMKSLKAQLKVKELHFASPEEMRYELNLTPGSVSIFGMIHAKRTNLILDEEVWKADITGFHPNINTETLEIKHEDLDRFVRSLKYKVLFIPL